MSETRFVTCNLCEAMCGLRVEVDGPAVTSLRGDDEDVFSRGHVCPKAHALRELFDDPDRIRKPRIRDGATWRDASWDEAMDVAATKLRDIRKRHGRDAVAVYIGNPNVHTHRGTMGSALLGTTLGTKNRYDANSQDSNPRLFACMQMFGDALALAVPDIERTDYLLVLGANPAASNGSMWVLGDPKRRFADVRARGGKIVLVDPRRTETASWCTTHHFIRPGGDAALLLALLHVVFEERLARIDAVVATRVSELRAICKELAPERVAGAIGIGADVIRGIARELATTKRAAVYSRVGVCQNEFGPVASWLVEALNIVTGHFDREGGVMFPEPAADIGPLGRKIVGNDWGRWRSRVRGLPEFLGALPSAVMAEEMETPGPGQIRALVCLAGNPVSSTPNGARLERAISKLDFVLGVDFYANETTRHAHVLLPPKHVFEIGNYDVLLSRFSVRNIAKYSPPIVETNDDTRDDWTIAVELAARVHARPARRAIVAAARNLPERFIDVLLRTGPRRTSLREIERAEHGVDYGPLERSKAPRRANLAPDALARDVPRVAKWIDEQRGDLVMIGRRHLRSNNSWLHNVRSLAKGPDRARLMIHPLDAARLSLANGVAARVESRVGEVTVPVEITDEVMPGVVSLPHGFGHQAAASTLRVAGALPGVSANALTDEQNVEPIIGTSILNGVPVTVTPAGRGSP
jgi:anaerobic selenocysteine-containing dehydrogenase